MENNIAIEVRNLTKIYPIYKDNADRLKESLSLTRKKYHKDFYALNNVSFAIEKGEVFGIVGQNGSGKSTILKIITGVLSQTSGELEVNGKISALLELGAGFNQEMTGMENIYLNGTIMGYSKEEMDVKIPQIVEFASIGDFINQPVKMYSSGMFARLAFAVAINVEPEILIVDEALSVGDMRFQIKCMDHMKKMMEGGTTVIFVSHDTNAIRRFCTKAIWLHKGEMLSIGTVDDVVDGYIDFLKLGEDAIHQNKEKVQESDKKDVKPFVPGDNIAEIIDFEITDRSGNEIDQCDINDKISICVTYDVYDENIEMPVLGIALRTVDRDYCCGLNTLLDSVKIPWKYGRNQFKLEYTKGMCVVGGMYEFDVAIFDKTATIPIHYTNTIKKIKVTSKYIGEGRIIIPHQWKEVNDIHG